MSRPLVLEDLVVWQLASELEKGVVALVQRTPAARDFRFASQLTEAVGDVVSDVSEGFNRFRAAEFASFIRYARASLAETESRLRGGVLKNHFTQADIDPLLRLCKRLSKAMANFHAYLLRKADEKRRRDRRERRRR